MGLIQLQAQCNAAEHAVLAAKTPETKKRARAKYEITKKAMAAFLGMEDDGDDDCPPDDDDSAKEPPKPAKTKKVAAKKAKSTKKSKAKTKSLAQLQADVRALLPRAAKLAPDAPPGADEAAILRQWGMATDDKPLRAQHAKAHRKAYQSQALADAVDETSSEAERVAAAFRLGGVSRDQRALIKSFGEAKAAERPETASTRTALDPVRAEALRNAGHA